MQRQNKLRPVTDFVLFPIPAAAFEDAGISAADRIYYTSSKGAIIIERCDTEDAGDYCDADCRHCPFNNEECDDDCEHCPCKYVCEDSEVTEL